MKVFEDTAKSALQHAFKLLGYRDRSEKEMRGKLAQKGFSEGVIGETLRLLKEKRFIDDGRLAEILKRDAVERRHFGRRGAKGYLLKRGIPGDVADAVLGGADEYLDAARELVEKKLKTLKGYDREAVRRKLWGVLSRRGFSSDVIRQAMKSFWDKEEFDENG
ncbi:MAG: regulatory protein RecX [Thermodesulfovibrionales bacterium]